MSAQGVSLPDPDTLSIPLEGGPKTSLVYGARHS